MADTSQYTGLESEINPKIDGWFAVKRGITSHHLFKGKPDRLAVWMWLLDNVAWKATTHDVKGKTVAVPRGAVCASERHIADACGVGYQVVRTAIKRFKSEQMVNAQPTHGKSLISLCNYEKYQARQGGANAEGNATLTQPQRNPNAQKEQGNKVTKEEAKASLVQSAFSQQDFQDFWDAYPHRGGKKKRSVAEAAFSKAIKSGVSVQAIAIGVENMRHDPDVQRGYSRDPTSWLNQKGWTDDFSAPPKFTAINGGYNDQPANKSRQRLDAFLAGATETG